MNVLLIHPRQGTYVPSKRGRSTRSEPIGLEYIAASVAKVGHKVMLLWEPTGREVKSFSKKIKPDVVCMSVYSCGIKEALILRDIIKRENKDAKFIYGGLHPSSSTSMLKYDKNGISVAGEADLVINEILKNIDNPSALKKIKGVYLKETNRIEICDIPPIDKVPWPYRDMEILKRSGITSLMYPPKKKQTGMATVITSRGCKNGCEYCGMKVVHGTGVRIRDYNDLKNELAYLQNEFNIEMVFFADSFINMSIPHLENVCNVVGSLNNPINWCAHFSMSVFSEKTIRQMARTNCRKLLIGVESIRSERLKSFKGRPFVNFDSMVDKFILINNEGILAKAFIMIGFPDETNDNLKHLENHIHLLPADELQITFYTPTPGTEAFEDENIKWIKNNEKYGAVSLHSPAIIPDHVSIRKLQYYRQRIMERFYSSDEYTNRIRKKSEDFPYLQESYEDFYTSLKAWKYIK